MASPSFIEALDIYSDSQIKSQYSIEAEQKFSDSILEMNTYTNLSDYRIECSDRLCFGYVSASTTEDMSAFIKEFTSSENARSGRAGGYLTMINTKTDSEYQTRISFNSDPDIKSISLPVNN